MVSVSGLDFFLLYDFSRYCHRASGQDHDYRILVPWFWVGFVVLFFLFCGAILGLPYLLHMLGIVTFAQGFGGAKDPYKTLGVSVSASTKNAYILDVQTVIR